MKRKILTTILTLSIVLSMCFTTVKAEPLRNISNIWRYEKEKTGTEDIYEDVIMDDDKLVVEVEGQTTYKQIEKAVKDVAEHYEVISGEFEIDEKLPKEKKDRLEKYLKSKNYTTLL